MRTLEDLGISRPPWSVGKIGVPRCIISSENEIVAVERVTKHGDANARLIAAAPDCYRALREAVIEMCHDCPSCEGSENGYKCDDPSGRCFVQKWRDVLEKAAGEEDRNG